MKNIREDIVATQLTQFLGHLERLIQKRCTEYFSQDSEPVVAGPETELEMPDFWLPFSPNSAGIALSGLEYSLLSIGLVAHVQPQFFDDSIRKNLPQAGDFPQLGGVRGKNFRGFLPTGETALFLLAGTDLEKRLNAQKLFSTEHFFHKKRILWLEDVPTGEPRMSGKIILSHEFVEWFMTGKITPPAFTSEFPARLIETQLTWHDLVLDPEIMTQIRELKSGLSLTTKCYGLADE
jgi:hypothetical protein